MGMGRKWTKEDEAYLSDNWGYISVPGLCKQLNRTKSAILIRVQRLGLPPFLDSGEYVTLNQLIQVVTGSDTSYSYKMKSWVENRGLPVHNKRNSQCTWRVVYIDEFWKWAEKNKGFLDFSKMEPLILGKEPDWVIEQRRQDFACNANYRKDPWSPQEDARLKDYLKQFKYGYLELSQILGRSAGAIQRRICDLKLKERPVKADNHKSWEEKHFQILADMIRAGYSYGAIGEVLEKSEKAIRGRVFDFYRTENADKVRSMLGDGAWGTGKPELTTFEARRRVPVKKDLTKLMELLLIRRNQLGYEPYWQRHMCMKWHDIRGCTAGQEDCDNCIDFERIKPQYCVRCGATFFERESDRLCKRCRSARKKQHQKKWRILQRAGVMVGTQEQEFV
ncbi:MAG: hypothetical protein K0R50_423 [Eubacterium sp.]|jgi:hypothetical protein|nr:hypothetical protein [Eubacterium sp.]